MQKGRRWPAVVVIVGAVVVAVIDVIVATRKNPSGLAVGLLQGIALVLGIYGSYVFGRESSRDAARLELQQQARASFRRVLSMYDALRRLVEQIALRAGRLRDQEDEAGMVAMVEVRAAMEVLEAHVLEQISTADVTVEDWRDVVPADVEEIEKRTQGRGNE